MLALVGLCFALVWPALAMAAPKQALVLLSENSALYQEAANAIREGLEIDGRVLVRTQVLSEANLQSLQATPDVLLVPLGTKATQAVAQLEMPVLAGLVTQATYVKHLQENTRKRQASAVYLEQPLNRYLQLLRLVQPKAKTVGAIFGNVQISDQQLLSNAAQSNGLRLQSARLNNGADLFGVLQSLLPNVDALLLLPDPLVVNRNSVQHLMLSAYRQHVPAIGYSASMVEAGALAAVYSTPQQIGKQMAETIIGMAGGRNWDLPLPAYPKYFSIKTNASVARSLEIQVPLDGVLLQRMTTGAGL